MVQSLSVDDFFAYPGPILDVRSPGEYEQGHIPEAISVPLFSDDERAQVGICYKRQGREDAIELGLDLVGTKLATFVRLAKGLADSSRWANEATRSIRVHCWRGGMRSGSMAWLLETAGLSVVTLDGGYKSFRHWVRSTLSQPKPIISLGGMTGTGKTLILHELAKLGEHVIDLEGLANHRGSSFGNLGLPPQPSTEHFENLLAMEWATLEASRAVWIEAESRRIGTCRIPEELFTPMMQAPVIQIGRSRAERIAHLVQEYGEVGDDGLIAATDRIRKKLGGLRTQQATEAIQHGDLATATDIILEYYDKTYTYDLNQKRDVPIYPVNLEGMNPKESAQHLMTQAQHFVHSLHNGRQDS
ncbi:MAG: tRNA 2-selenouridine(34) synthase MnmH [Cyanobacteria bacterium P01_E01_bin.6]